MRETIQNANGKQFHAVSLSGGKDSTAMLLLMIERDMPINMVLPCWMAASASCSFAASARFCPTNMISPSIPSTATQRIMTRNTPLT